MTDIKLIKCPACGKEISVEAASCPACGQPVTGEVKAEALKTIAEKAKKDTANKKTARIGCLTFLIWIALYAIYGVITSPEKRFSFDEDMFMTMFTQRINDENTLKQYGNIQCTKIKSDKKESVYNINSDAELVILKDEDTGKIWQISIKYDNNRNYNEKIVIAAVEEVSLTLWDFDYSSLSGFSTFANAVRLNVMSLSRNKRSGAEPKSFKTYKTKDGNEISILEVDIMPSIGTISFSACEASSTIEIPGGTAQKISIASSQKSPNLAQTVKQTPPPRHVPDQSNFTSQDSPSEDFAITKDEWAMLMKDTNFKMADQKLNETYKQALAAFNEVGKPLLRSDQRFWATDREKRAFENFRKGTPEYVRFLIDEAHERIKVLQDYRDLGFIPSPKADDYSAE